MVRAGGVGQISVATTNSGYRATTALANLGAVWKIFFSYGFLAYVAVVLAILMSLFLNRTRQGLDLRAVSESLPLLTLRVSTSPDISIWRPAAM